MVPSGAQTKDSPANVETVLIADAIAERHEVAMLKRCNSHLPLVKTLRPLVERAGLRHDDEIGAAERKRPHVFRVVTVVTDGHADRPGPGLIDRRTGITWRVIALLVEAGILRDVNHPRASEERAVGIDDRRTIEATVPVALVEVEDNDDAELASAA